MKAFSQLICCAILFSSVAASAQGNPGKGKNTYENHVYDPHTVIHFNGKITEVQRTGHEGGRGTGIHLIVQTKTSVYTVLLGPAWYADKQGIALKAGDQVTVAGFKTDTNGEIIAKDIVSKGKTIKFRDEAGNPEWAGKQK